MNLGILSSTLRYKRGIEAIEAMEGRTRTNIGAGMADDSNKRRAQLNGNVNNRSNYFSVQSFLVLLCLTASLLILPLILPPLPPPPVLLLLLPIGIFVLLLVLAFMLSDVRDIASSYL